MFNESNTIEAYLQTLLSGPESPAPQGARGFVVNDPGPACTIGRGAKGVGWHFVSSARIPRQPQDVFVESWVRAALIHLNPEIASQPDRADEVLYRLRAIVLSVRSDGLIRANEEMTAWLRGERSMPFGHNNEHVAVRLIDFDTPDNNQFVITRQYTFRAGSVERRADLVLLVNGLPLVLIEAKTHLHDLIKNISRPIKIDSVKLINLTI